MQSALTNMLFIYGIFRFAMGWFYFRAGSDRFFRFFLFVAGFQNGALYSIDKLVIVVLTAVVYESAKTWVSREKALLVAETAMAHEIDAGQGSDPAPQPG